MVHIKKKEILKTNNNKYTNRSLGENHKIYPPKFPSFLALSSHPCQLPLSQQRGVWKAARQSKTLTERFIYVPSPIRGQVDAPLSHRILKEQDKCKCLRCENDL